MGQTRTDATKDSPKKGDLDPALKHNQYHEAIIARQTHEIIHTTDTRRNIGFIQEASCPCCLSLSNDALFLTPEGKPVVREEKGPPHAGHATLPPISLTTFLRSFLDPDLQTQANAWYLLDRIAYGYLMTLRSEIKDNRDYETRLSRELIWYHTVMHRLVTFQDAETADPSMASHLASLFQHLMLQSNPKESSNHTPSLDASRSGSTLLQTLLHVVVHVPKQGTIHAARPWVVLRACLSFVTRFLAMAYHGSTHATMGELASYNRCQVNSAGFETFHIVPYRPFTPIDRLHMPVITLMTSTLSTWFYNVMRSMAIDPNQPYYEPMLLPLQCPSSSLPPDMSKCHNKDDPDLVRTIRIAILTRQLCWNPIQDPLMLRCDTHILQSVQASLTAIRQSVVQAMDRPESLHRITVDGNETFYDYLDHYAWLRQRVLALFPDEGMDPSKCLKKHIGHEIETWRPGASSVFLSFLMAYRHQNEKSSIAVIRVLLDFIEMTPSSILFESDWYRLSSLADTMLYRNDDGDVPIEAVRVFTWALRRNAQVQRLRSPSLSSLFGRGICDKMGEQHVQRVLETGPLEDAVRIIHFLILTSRRCNPIGYAMSSARLCLYDANQHIPFPVLTQGYQSLLKYGELSAKDAHALESLHDSLVARIAYSKEPSVCYLVRRRPRGFVASQIPDESVLAWLGGHKRRTHDGIDAIWNSIWVPIKSQNIEPGRRPYLGDMDTRQLEMSLSKALQWVLQEGNRRDGTTSMTPEDIDLVVRTIGIVCEPFMQGAQKADGQSLLAPFWFVLCEDQMIHYVADRLNIQVERVLAAILSLIQDASPQWSSRYATRMHAYMSISMMLLTNVNFGELSHAIHHRLAAVLRVLLDRRTYDPFDAHQALTNAQSCRVHCVYADVLKRYGRHTAPPAVLSAWLLAPLTSVFYPEPSSASVFDPEPSSTSASVTSAPLHALFWRHVRAGHLRRMPVTDAALAPYMAAEPWSLEDMLSTRCQLAPSTRAIIDTLPLHAPRHEADDASECSDDDELFPVDFLTQFIEILS